MTWRHALLAAILLVAAHFQFTAVLRTEVNQPLRADAAEYASYAFNLVRHGTFSKDPTWHPSWPAGVAPTPDAMRTPGYPLLLAAVMPHGPTPRAILDAELVQAALAVLVVALSYLLIRPLLGFGAACTGALLLALTPQFVTASTYLLTEVWFALWVVLGLLALSRALREPRGALAFLALAGLAFGVSALVRPTLQYLPVLLAPALYFAFRGARPWRAAIAFALPCALSAAPWIARNEITLGRAGDPSIPRLSVLDGSYAGYMYRDDPESYGFPRRFDPDSDRIGESTANVVAHVRSEFERRPLRMLRWYLIEKPLYLFAWDPIQGEGDIFVYPVMRSPYFERGEFVASRGAMLLIHWPLMIGGLLGALAVWWSRFALRFDPALRAALRVLSLVLAFTIAIHIVAASFPRYSVPFRPVSILFALVLVVGLRRMAHAEPAP